MIAVQPLAPRVAGGAARRRGAALGRRVQRWRPGIGRCQLTGTPHVRRSLQARPAGENRWRDPAPWPSGKAADCKSAIRRFDSDRRLWSIPSDPSCSIEKKTPTYPTVRIAVGVSRFRRIGTGWGRARR